MIGRRRRRRSTGYHHSHARKAVLAHSPPPRTGPPHMYSRTRTLLYEYNQHRWELVLVYPRFLETPVAGSTSSADSCSRMRCSYLNLLVVNAAGFGTETPKVPVIGLAAVPAPYPPNPQRLETNVRMGQINQLRDWLRTSTSEDAVWKAIAIASQVRTPGVTHERLNVLIASSASISLLYCVWKCRFPRLCGRFRKRASRCKTCKSSAGTRRRIYPLRLSPHPRSSRASCPYVSAPGPSS